MKKTIEKMIHLARLKLPPEEQERFEKKAKHVLEYVEKLNTIDASKLEATSHAVEQTNAFREDVVQKFENSEDILKIAPERFENFFEVCKVIE